MSHSQLERLVSKLLSSLESEQISRLPRADYNKSSDAQLKMAKNRMTQVFEENVVRPGDKDFVYDKKIEFAQAEEDSGWD